MPNVTYIMIASITELIVLTTMQRVANSVCATGANRTNVP